MEIDLELMRNKWVLCPESEEERATLFDAFIEENVHCGYMLSARGYYYRIQDNRVIRSEDRIHIPGSLRVTDLYIQNVDPISVEEVMSLIGGGVNG